MKIISFMREGHQMMPIEVELSLSPGLPRVEFTGLADLSNRECVTRLKLAFSAQKFSWPKKSQITINLRPAYIKKSSYGLDLAIAYALLLKTKQISSSVQNLDQIYVYGEVTLNGDVEAPEDWVQIGDRNILTGRIRENDFLNDVYSVDCLRDLESPKFLKAKSILQILKKPVLPDIYFSKNSAKLLEIVSSGEHSILLAGEPGSGKTTLASHIPYLLRFPCKEEFRESRRVSQYFGEKLSWRPFVAPHHSTPALSMIGGGFPPFLGEISRAHGGVLFLDEYLEFQPRVQESLREPIEQGRIFISRKGEGVSFPSRFTLISATNLCPCGSYVPGKEFHCSYSLRKCRSRLERLNGPMLDRFDILSFSTYWKGDLKVPIKEVDQRVQRAEEYRKKRGQECPNGRLSWEDLSVQVDSFILENLMPSHVVSHRRKLSLLRVARTLADLEREDKISPAHIELSKSYTLRPFNQVLLDQ